MRSTTKRPLTAAMVLLAGWTAAGCDESDRARDGGPEDAGTWQVAPPQPPSLTCPTGWWEDQDTEHDTPPVCWPWMVAPQECPRDQDHFAGEPGCSLIGDPCGPWPSSIPADRPVIYASADGVASAAGTREDPQDARTAASNAAAGTVVALAPGIYRQNIHVPTGVTLLGSCVEQTVLQPTEGTALFIDGTQTQVRNLRIDNEGGAGILLDPSAAEVVIQDIVIDQALGIGVVVPAGASLRIEDSSIRGVERYSAGLAGYAIHAEGDLELRRATIIANRAGILIRASAGTLEDVVFLENDTACLLLYDNANVTGRRLGVVFNARGIAIQSGSHLSLEQSTCAWSTNSWCLTLAGSSTVQVDGLGIVESQAGVGAWEGSSVELTDLIYRLSDRPPRDEFGVLIVDSQLTAERVLTEAAPSIGVAILGETSRATLNDLDVRRTTPNDIGFVGRGIAIESGATVTGARWRFVDNRDVGIAAFESSLEVQDVEVVGTGARRCDMGLCEGFPGGTGVFMNESVVSLERFSVRNNYLAGLRLRGNTSISVRRGEVVGHPVGLSVATDRPLGEIVGPEVEFRDNERNLATETVPDPEQRTLPVPP